MSNLPPPIQTQQTQLPNFVTNATEYIGDAAQSVSRGYNNIRENVSTTLSGFSENASAGVGASQQFLNSNTIIAKFAFVILIILLFIFLLGLGINIVQYFVSPGDNPYIIKGMISGADSTVISQNPSQKKSVTIRRSNNEKTGIEFTWSVWLYINDTASSNKSTYQHVFNKGDNNYDVTTGLAKINNAPGLYIGNNSGSVKLHIVMNTMGPNTQATNSDLIADIPNIPLKKWVNVIIRMENLMLDIYINGIITERLMLPYVPKQNYDDIQICQNNGFSGNLSNLRYYDKALSVIQINNIVYWGPNTSASTSTSSTKGGYDYLSSTWYTGLSV
jgi:hypothetical protein